jgi:hypothetical protein
MFIIKKISLEYKLYMQTSITLEQCKQETPVKMLRKSTAKTSKKTQKINNICEKHDKK